MNIIATLRSSKFPTEEEKRLSREKTNEFIKTIPLKKGLKVKLQNVEYLKELTISRAAVRNWRSHPHKYVIAKNEAITDIQKLFKRAEYYGWAEDDIIVNPNGNSFQKHPDVKYWLYYKVLIYDELSYICVKVTNEGLYVPYCINDQNAWKSGLVNKIRKNKPLK